MSKLVPHTPQALYIEDGGQDVPFPENWVPLVRYVIAQTEELGQLLVLVRSSSSAH
jgi:hypothetical protein